MTFAQMFRLIWIDTHVAEWGYINRADLMAAFGISMPQAARDLAAFQNAWPDAIRYDRCAKRYIAGATSPIFDRATRNDVMDAAESVRASIEAMEP